jgi:hypothetical protein
MDYPSGGGPVALSGMVRSDFARSAVTRGLSANAVTPISVAFSSAMVLLHAVQVQNILPELVGMSIVSNPYHCGSRSSVFVLTFSLQAKPLIRKRILGVKDKVGSRFDKDDSDGIVEQLKGKFASCQKNGAAPAFFESMLS